MAQPMTKAKVVETMAAKTGFAKKEVSNLLAGLTALDYKEAKKIFYHFWNRQAHAYEQEGQSRQEPSDRSSHQDTGPRRWLSSGWQKRARTQYLWNRCFSRYNRQRSLKSLLFNVVGVFSVIRSAVQPAPGMRYL